MGIFKDDVEFNKHLRDKAGESKKDWTQVEEDDDGSGGDQGSGGASKGLLGFFKREKLFSLIEEGTFKADTFQSFLNKDYLDKSELEKSELTVESEQEEAKSAQEAEEQPPKLPTPDLDLEPPSEFESQVNEAAAALDSQQNKAQATPSAVEAPKIAGSIIGPFANNLFGFNHQTEASGAMASADSLHTVEMGWQAKSGKIQGANFGMYHADHVGFIRQSWIGSDRAEQKTAPNKQSFLSNEAAKTSSNEKTATTAPSNKLQPTLTSQKR